MGRLTHSQVQLDPAATAPAAVNADISRSFPREWFGLFGVWVVLTGALVWRAYNVGITADEPSHLISASLYWKGNDILLPRDMPPLIKIAAGAAPATHHVPIPYETQAYKSRSEWQTALELMLNLPKPEIQPLFFYARLPMIVFPVLSTLILFLWGRALFGPAAGVVAAFLFAFEPTALGHGALVKNDHAATFAYLFFCYRAWHYWKRPDWSRLGLLALAAGLAVMAKLSLLIVLFLAPLLILGRSFLRDSPRWWQSALRAILLLVAVYGLLLATSWFDIRPLHPHDFEKLRMYRSLPSWITIVAWPFQYLPVPFLYWDGVISLLGSQGDGSPVYLFGDVVERGSLMYFPTAIALKSPLPFQVLLVLGLTALVVAVKARSLSKRDALFLLMPPLIYIGCASLVSMQLGLRLILPALPFGVLIAAASLRYAHTSRRRLTLALLVASVGVVSARHLDTLIGYYNVWAGPPEKATAYIANSNVDWGQDLPALNRWFRQTKPGRIHLFYFGMDNSDRFFKEEELERMPTPWNMELIKSNKFRPEPGYYGVSVNHLRGSFFSEGYRDYLECFRSMKPIHYAGASIYIYKVS